MNLWVFLAMLMQPVSQLHADQTCNNGYTLTVWASPDLVSQYNYSIIYAQLTDQYGAAVEGVTLNFNAASGDGSLGTYSSTTDSNGQCAVGYQAGGSSAQINVFDGNGFGLSTSCVVNVIQPPQPPNYQLWISAGKNPLINGETTNVNVCIMDVTTWSGLNGATVYFTVSSNDAVLGALSATTDANGNCSVPVTAGSSTSQISAWSYPSSGGTTSNSFLLQCPSSGDAFNLDVSAEQAAVPQNGSTTLHSSISDTTLGLPMSGTQVVFSIQSGDGRLIDIFGNSTTQVTTYADQNGNSALSFWSGTQPTTILVTATNGTTTQTQTLNIGVLADNTYHLNLWSNQSMLKCGEQATLTAQLINDTLGIPVSGSQLYFQITNGDGTLSSYQSYYASTDSNGVCNIAFTGGNYSSTVSVCDLSGYSTYQNTSIGVYTTNPTCSLTLSAGNNVLLSGASTVLHTQFWDSTTGLPISGGAINFAVSTGDGVLTTEMGYTTMPNFTAYTDVNGNCDLYFVGGTMPSYVTATAADYQQVSTGYPFGVIPDTYIMYLSPSQVTLPVGSATTFTAQLYNTTRSAFMTDTPVLFTVTGGDASIGSGGRSYPATTDSNGYANVSVTNGSIASTITVTDQVGYGASASGVIYPPANYSLTMTADRTKLMHNHSSPIHLLLTDISTYPPTPVPYTTLTLYLSGEDGSNTVTTGSDGSATATYVMGAQSETVTASATDNDGHSTTNSISFTLAPAPSYSLSVTVPPDESSLQAGQSTLLTATFLDETPLPIPGATVTWAVRPDPNGDNTGLGSVAGDGTTFNAGNAVALFIFGSKPTIVDVTASIWNADYSVTITSTFALTLTPLPPPCICGCTTCADVNGCSNGSCLPCVCKFAGDSNTPCSCASVGGCNNDCRSCQCDEVGDNCTCANDAGCMGGDCGPCICGTTGCDCSRKSADCNGGCMDCKCGGGDCHCETRNACGVNISGCSGGGGDSKDTGLSITVDVGSMTATLRAGSDSGQITVSYVLANGTSLPVTKAIMDPGESQTLAFTMSDIAPWPYSTANFIAYYTVDSDTANYEAKDSIAPVDIKRDTPGKQRKVTWESIEGVVAKALPGQKINLKLDLPYGITATDYQWTITGGIFADYDPQVPPHGAHVTALQSSDFTGPEMHFYWSQSGTQTVHMNCLVGGTPQYFTKTIEVVAPVCTFEATQKKFEITSVYQYSNYIRWKAKVDKLPTDFPDGGKWIFVQNICVTDHLSPPSGQVGKWNKHDGQWCLDAYPSYTLISYGNLSGKNDGEEDHNSDPPTGPANNDVGNEQFDQQFRTYVMFKSNESGALWVPLKVINWGMGFKSSISTWHNSTFSDVYPPTDQTLTGTETHTLPEWSHLGSFEITTTKPAPQL
jgi:hypothetical protein